jgi:ribonucleoside-diphosphate reductase alpha chain
LPGARVPAINLPPRLEHRSNDGLDTISQWIWATKYRYATAGGAIDQSLSDTWRRVAAAVASVETGHLRDWWMERFVDAMSGSGLLPAGRILAGAGTPRDVTLMNTFAMGTIDDSMAGLMDAVRQGALTMRMGGGIGFDFSTLRPKGFAVAGLDCGASGPLAAMDVCNAMSMLMADGPRRGAMMATMRCDHPDIEAFVTAKSERGRFNNFNLSVMITDEFMHQLECDGLCRLRWEGVTVRTLPASALWNLIMRQNYDAAEPGVLFIDRINAGNPLAYAETIATTNSCAEQPLPPFGVCPLASINLAVLVTRPFEAEAALDRPALHRLVEAGVRLLDNVVDLSRYPLPQQADEAHQKRRIGLGVTGVADALVMMGIRYGSQRAADCLESWMREIHLTAVATSISLAREKGAFPAFDADAYLSSPTVARLPATLRRDIARYGIRNALLTSIAPTGSISLLAGNVSSGIEPIFATSFKRWFIGPGGQRIEQDVVDHAVLRHRRQRGEDIPLPRALVTAAELTPAEHVRMQAAAQRWTDGSISKTVNCPAGIPFDVFKDIYIQAFASGCKGCTTYRPNDVTGSVFSVQ